MCYTNDMRWSTGEALESHFRSCKGTIKCKHETGKLNEFGDCFECDGEGTRMCPCQDEEYDNLAAE